MYVHSPVSVHNIFLNVLIIEVVDLIAAIETWLHGRVNDMRCKVTASLERTRATIRDNSITMGMKTSSNGTILNLENDGKEIIEEC